MEIVDHRLVGALHVDLVDRAHAGAVDDSDGAFQTSTLEALLDGAYEGDLTVGELLAHGDLGLGTVDHLDGELVVLDGEAHVVRGDGSVEAVAPETGTPFAAVCRFRPGAAEPLGPLHHLGAVLDAVDAAVGDAPLVAVRLDGRFTRARVRSVARQEPPYPPLREVTAHQREWDLAEVEGTVVGFRFPDASQGLEVPGWHLHLLTADRRAGGHVIDLAVLRGELRHAEAGELHVEVPASVAVADPGGRAADRTAEIVEVEGRRGDRPAGAG